VTKAEVIEIIKEVAAARGLSYYDLITAGGTKNMRIVSARRAVGVICWDKWKFSPTSQNALSFGDVAKLLGMARSSLHASARAWINKDGAQDGKYEKNLREKGCLLPQGQESIHQMAQRVCERRARTMPKGRGQKLGYVFAEKVNYG
tara:strand:+ start:2560 stop:3000 length:441 start_codon:yes stop_codon:yes gene_type:complete